MKLPTGVPYWSLTKEEALHQIRSNSDGLSAKEAADRLKGYGENTIKEKKRLSQLNLFLNQFKNPIILILLFATSISALTGDWFDAEIILLIIVASAGLSFYQEYSAGQAVEKLKSKVQITCTVKRDGHTIEIPSRLIVPGDIVFLSGGNLIPADGLILESFEFFVNQSFLTGESISVAKKEGPVPEEAGIVERKNCVYMGTNVYSGNATVLVMETGKHTQYGEIAENLTLRPPETEFERGVRQFGYLLSEIMLILTLLVFTVNVLYDKPAIDSLLFSVALAVGITPQLLPAIISITLSKGARLMANKGVVVQRLNSIENFGSMDVLCTDKTGTLTEGDIQLDDGVDFRGRSSRDIVRLAYLNATLQTGMKNTLDEAIKKFQQGAADPAEKVGEIPFDFTRERLSVVYRENDRCTLVEKGALSSVLETCSTIDAAGKVQPKTEALVKELNHRYEAWSNQGIRVLGLAEKTVSSQSKYTVEDEQGLTFKGFLLFSDHPKEDAPDTIAGLLQSGVALRIITGDNQLIALYTARSVGLEVTGVLTGRQLREMSDETLWQKVELTNLFVEVDPNQKERIILALKKQGHVVGVYG